MNTSMSIEATLREIRHSSNRDLESIRILNEVRRNASRETEMTGILKDLQDCQNGDNQVLLGITRRELDEIKENMHYAQVEADRKRLVQEMLDDERKRIMENVKVRKICCHQTCALPAIEYQNGKIIVFNEHRGQKHVNYIDINWICEQAARDGKTDEIIERLRSAKTP